MVAKRWDSRYLPGRRSPAWIKVKHWQQATLPIVGWGATRRGTVETLRYAGTVEWGLPARAGT